MMHQSRYDGMVNLFQTEVDVTKMEPFQGHKTKMERQDKVEQRDMAMLAHAV